MSADKSFRATSSLTVLVWAAFAAAITATMWSWGSGGIVYEVMRSDVTAADRVDQLRTFFGQFGVLAPLVYFAFVVVEVIVAPIPGLMLYAPGGALFGTLIGGSVSLAGNVAGAGIACAMTRSIRPGWVSRYFAAEKLEAIQGELERRGSWFIFLLRVNPLTSSDIVSYAAGFTRIPIWKVMTATAVGMAPLCFVQSWLAESLLTTYPGLVYPLVGMSLLFMAFVVFVLARLGRRDREPCAAEPTEHTERPSFVNRDAGRHKN